MWDVGWRRRSADCPVWLYVWVGVSVYVYVEGVDLSVRGVVS